MRPLARLCLLALCAALLLIACEKPEKRDVDAIAEKKATSQAPTVHYEGSQLSETDQRSVVAQVNGEDFTLGEFERRLNSQAPFARARYNTRERKVDFLNNMVQFEVLADEAERLGYDKNPEVVLELKQAMVRRMMADKMAREVRLEDITDAEMRAYYDAHKGDYVRPEKVRASQLVVADEATANKVLAELRDELSKNPTDLRKVFSHKAKEVSLDKATANLGGDMRFFARPEDGGTVNPKVAEAAFGIEKVGQLAGPIQTDSGWHIVMLTARKQRFEKTFDEVQRTIQNRLFREKRTEHEKQFVESVKGGARLTVNDGLLDRIPDPPDDGRGADPHDALPEQLNDLNGAHAPAPTPGDDDPDNAHGSGTPGTPFSP